MGERITVLPVLFHLLWMHALRCDLWSAPLSGDTMVMVAARLR
jgi:hypothetical protein